MNYKIIGGDGKEYGPISAEQLRQWISEGRLSAQSSVRVEGSTEWKLLGTLAEFAADFPMTQAPPPYSSSGFSAPATLEGIFSRDYDLDLGGCIARGWGL